MAKEKKVVYVSTKLLDIDAMYNRREDYGDINQLKESIVENGVITPLVVYANSDETRYTIISGHRRKEAIRQLIEEDGYGDFQVPAIVEEVTDEKRTVARIIIDNDGKPMTALEEGSVFFTLSEMGLSLKKIAEQCGRSDTTVSNYLLLFSADEKIKALIREGKMSVKAAVEMLRKDTLDTKQEDVDSEAFGGLDGEHEEGESEVGKQIKDLPADKVGSGKTKSKGSISIESLERLLEQLEEIGDEDIRNQDAFAALSGIIQWGIGDLGYTDLAAIFFNEDVDVPITNTTLGDE